MRDAQHEALEKLKREVGPGDPKPHRGGYLTADEVATLVYYWAAGGEEHGPNEADGIVVSLSITHWGGDTGTLRAAGIVLALCELYPDLEPGWRAMCPEMFQSIRWAMKLPADNEGWNVFHLVQWFILRKARPDEGIEILDKLLDRMAEGGEVGYDARQMIMGVSKGCKPFEVCMERARVARSAKMLVQ